MLDIGWSELLIVVTIAIIVVGPKELPALMKSIGAMIRKVKSTAEDFKYQFDDTMRESEFGDIAASVKELGEQYSPDKIINDMSDELNDFDGDDWLKDNQGALTEQSPKTDEQIEGDNFTKPEDPKPPGAEDPLAAAEASAKTSLSVEPEVDSKLANEKSELSA